MEVRSDRTYLFRQPPQAVWDAIGRVDSYRRWWPWLRRFEASGLEAGARWSCMVRPPLPYVLRFAIEIEDVQPTDRISATVTGDVQGRATVELHQTSGGCAVRLVSALSPTGQPLKGITRVNPWLARFGHDWVLNTGLRQFRRRAL